MAQGVARNYLAAVRTDNTLVDGWNPNANNIVYTLARTGNATFAGGRFSTLNGGTTPRNLIAGMDDNGAVLSFDANVTGSAISAIEIGASVLAGGDAAVGETSEYGLLAFGASKKNDDPPFSWEAVPRFLNGGSWSVSTLAMNPANNKVYAGGFFDYAGDRLQPNPT